MKLTVELSKDEIEVLKELTTVDKISFNYGWIYPNPIGHIWSGLKVWSILVDMHKKHLVRESFSESSGHKYAISPTGRMLWEAYKKENQYSKNNLDDIEVIVVDNKRVFIEG